MKRVKEYLHEKFEEESDPVRDMGVGIKSIHNFQNDEDAAKFLFDVLPGICKTAEIPNDIIEIPKEETSTRYNWKYYWELVHYCKTYLRVNDKPVDFHGTESIYFKLRQKLLSCGYPKDKSFTKEKNVWSDDPYKNRVYEKFTQDSDPIHDMGIGILSEHDFETEGALIDFLVTALPAILKTDKIPDDIIEVKEKGKEYQPYKWKYYWELCHYVPKYIKFEGKKIRFESMSINGHTLYNLLQDRLKKMGYPKDKSFTSKKNPETPNPYLLYEKFKEESDPIKDLGIGVRSVHNFKSEEEVVDFLFNALPAILRTDEIPDDIVDTGTERGKAVYVWFNWKYLYELRAYCNKYVRLNGDNAGFNDRIYHGLKQKLVSLDYPKDKSFTREKNNIIDNPYENKIYEKFKEDSDPIRDLGIGITGPHIFKNVGELVDFIIIALPFILKTNSIPEDILIKGGNTGIIPNTLFFKICEFLRENDNTMADPHNTGNSHDFSSDTPVGFWNWPSVLKQRLLDMGFEDIDEY